MGLEGKKIAIFVADMYEDIEFWYPYYRMKEEGADVVVIGPKNGTYTGKKCLKVTADSSIKEVTPADFDGLIIPGGYAPDHIRRKFEMIDFVRKMNEEEKPIAAICHAAWVLASAGLLKNRNVTSFFSIKDDLVNAGAYWTDQEVVEDGNLITSRNPDDLPVFCKTIIKVLSV
ncbi:MAG: type 1 glutamine amidotransferase domain-containing protein [Bacteroidota bacterium]